MKSFNGKVAAITGAGSGVGRALALQLAQQNCALALSDVDERRSVRFLSGAESCDAWLYLPFGASPSQPVPVVVMAHGLGGIKQARLGAFAERFRAEGYACLVFDYRYFGESTGEPRQLLDIKSQIADWRAAVAFARSLPGINPDRVIVWGTSFGGGHAIITAAEDPRIAAAIAQCPFTDGVASARMTDWKTSAKLAVRAFRDLASRWSGRSPVRVPVVGQTGEVALMNTADAHRGYCAIMHAAGLYDPPEPVPARIVLQIPFHSPGRWAKKVQCPILFCVCENDSVAPARSTLKHAARAPKGEIKRYPEGHFDIYLGAPFERNVSDQIAFLKANVPISTCEPEPAQSE